jgi:hypothetical protein
MINRSGSSKTYRTVEKSTPCSAKLAASLAGSAFQLHASNVCRMHAHLKTSLCRRSDGMKPDRLSMTASETSQDAREFFSKNRHAA